jgi:hypothetical protein
MSRATLTALLETLGETFLPPGTFDPARLEATLKSDWATGPLKDALQRMLAAPRNKLGVLYAEHFLHGFRRPTVHLQASAHRTGSLLDPGLLHELEGLYALAGVEPVDVVHPDHLGALALLLGVLLQRLQSAEGPTADALESAAIDLVEDHLGPLLAKVQEGLNLADPRDPYRAAADALESCLGICARVLA